nr:hypothetical protein [Nanoarchaeum sp.]
KIGRFTSIDPVPTEPVYQYVGNNPVNFVDPSGMAPWGGLEQMAIDRNNPDYVYRNWVEEGPNGYETYGETNAGDTVNLGSAGNAMTVSVLEDPISVGVTGGMSALIKGSGFIRAVGQGISDSFGAPVNVVDVVADLGGNSKIIMDNIKIAVRIQKLRPFYDQQDADLLLDLAQQTERIARNCESGTCATAAVLNYLKTEKRGLNPIILHYFNSETKTTHVNVELIVGSPQDSYYPVLNAGTVFSSKESYLQLHPNYKLLRGEEFKDASTLVKRRFMDKGAYAMPRPQS